MVHYKHMTYTIHADSTAQHDASLTIKDTAIDFGTTESTAAVLPNPAELFLGSFAACILKNVERFSQLLHFTYESAHIEVTAVRLDRPPRMDSVRYVLTITSSDRKLRTELLKKNIEKFGTIYNTVQNACSVSGTIEKK